MKLSDFYFYKDLNKQDLIKKSLAISFGVLVNFFDTVFIFMHNIPNDVLHLVLSVIIISTLWYMKMILEIFNDFEKFEKVLSTVQVKD